MSIGMTSFGVTSLVIASLSDTPLGDDSLVFSFEVVLMMTWTLVEENLGWKAESVAVMEKRKEEVVWGGMCLFNFNNSPSNENHSR